MNPTQITANSLPARGAPVRIKELEKMVADVVVETPDTTTLVLFTGNDRLEYRAGHFLTIDPHQFEALERFLAFLERSERQERAAARLFVEFCAARAPSRRHRERGALRLGSREIPAAAVTPACEANGERNASG